MNKVRFVNGRIDSPSAQLNLLPILTGMEPACLDYALDLDVGVASVRVRAACGIRSGLEEVEILQISNRVSEEHRITLIPDFDRGTLDVVLKYGISDGDFVLKHADIVDFDGVDACASASDPSSSAAVHACTDARVAKLLDQVEIDLLIASSDFAEIHRPLPASARQAAA